MIIITYIAPNENLSKLFNKKFYNLTENCNVTK